MDTIVAVERKSKDFVAFCLAFLLSAFGYEFLFFIMTIRVYGLTNKAMQVGIFAALTFFPKIFSLYYYVVVDRFDPRNVLAFDALAIFALTIAIGSMNDIVAIYVLWTILSVFVMCLSNARTVLMTQVFSRGDIVRGNSLVLSFLNVARLLTPLAAGFLSRFLVFKTIVLISSLIYLGCGVASMLLNPGGERAGITGASARRWRRCGRDFGSSGAPSPSGPWPRSASCGDCSSASRPAFSSSTL